MKTQIERLEELKERVSRGNVSVLVGAGMSKNVFHEYPSWSELLKDAVRELYGDAASLEFKLATHGRTVDPGELDKFLDQRIEHIIRGKGYLAVVSEYIRQYGYTESIASYIEARTPFATIGADGSLVLRRGGQHSEKIKLPIECLSLHRKLLELPWNNIYTTNYDNLLEVCIDGSIKEKLEDHVARLRQDIVDISARRKQKADELSKAEADFNELRREFERPEIGPGDSIAVGGIQSSVSEDSAFEMVEKLRDLEIELSKKKRIIPREIEGHDRQLDGLSKTLAERLASLDECYAVVDDASQLGLKRNRNIVKLHGNLRESSTSPFGFDGDLRSHYIISDQDYQNYPTKHEAFTQLMRISLLQQCFCVIGFSGDDGNFHAWVSWVRDIIERKANLTKRDKVYFINLSTDPLSEAKQLFFENHQIQDIRLRDPDVLEHLAEKVGRSIDAKNMRDVLDAFFDYLRDDNTVDGPKAAIELLAQEEYRRFWQSLPNPPIDNERISFAGYVYPVAYKRINRISIHALNATSGQDNILRWAFEYMKAADDKKGFGRLLSHALDDYLVPVSCVDFGESSLLEEFLGNWGDDDRDFTGYGLALLRDSVWRGDHDLFESVSEGLKNSDDFDSLHDEVTYQHALLWAVSLNFDSLKELLENWKPSGMALIRKAGLSALFDVATAKQILKTAIPHLLLQDQLYALFLLKLLDFSLEGYYPAEIAEKIEVLKNEGLEDPQEALDFALKIVKETGKRIEPLGIDKFGGERRSLSKESKYVSSIQYLGIHFELAMPFAVPGVTTLSHQELYPILKHSLGAYPFVVVFVAVQYSDDKFLRRLGQDFALCDDLSRNLNDVLVGICNGYTTAHAPQNIKSNLLMFCSELIVAVKPTLWEDLFLAVWKDRGATRELLPFVEAGLKFIQNPEIFRLVVSDCLRVAFETNVSNQEMDRAIAALYRLYNNEAFSEVKSLVNDDIVSLIDGVIDRISSRDWRSIFLLNNILPLIDRQQMNRIRTVLQTFDFGGIRNPRVWRVFLSFSGDDQGIKAKIADAVSLNEGLWYSGIDGRKVASFVDFIPVHALRFSSNNENGLRWNEGQLTNMYRALVLELDKITSLQFDVGWHKDLLREMQLFLRQERDILEDTGEYRETLRRVGELIDKRNGFTDLQLGITSSEPIQVLSGFAILTMQLYQEGGVTEERARFIELILKKVLFQSEPGLTASLKYLSSWFSDFSDDIHIRSMEPLVVDVLVRYKEGLPQDVDAAYVWEQLVRLARVISEWNNEDPIIVWYKEQCKTSRYNNVNVLRFE